MMGAAGLLKRKWHRGRSQHRKDAQRVARFRPSPAPAPAHAATQHKQKKSINIKSIYRSTTYGMGSTKYSAYF